ncbi:MAG: hypothetical protein RLZZ53_2705 [Acidobacteriota bacterium]
MLAVILTVAAGLRVWAPWDDVLGGARVNFFETDAWYHVRLAESQVRNFPHRVTIDPYAAPDGQYVAVAPLLDTIISTAAFVTGGRQASTEHIERVAAFVPAIVGVLAVGVVWVLATLAFDRRAGMIAGLLAALLPGHFLDRSLIGFVDHHGLEVLLSFATLASVAYGSTIGAGIFLGSYLLAWASGAYFVAILALWVIVTAIVSPKRCASAAQFAAATSVIALAIVIAFQDPGLYRYGTQVAALVGLLLVSAMVFYFADQVTKLLAIGAVSAAVVVAVTWMLMPDLVNQVVMDVSRFRPDPTRMAVLEARPLFLYQGNWAWSQPWIFFRSGFYVGLIAVLALAIVTWFSKRVDHLLILCFTIANYVATIGQNRFGYYLVPSTAVVIAWLATRVLDLGGVPHADNPTPQAPYRLPFQRELAVIAVAGLVIAPNVVPAALTTARAGGMPQQWYEAMRWLRTNTPEPFGVADHYLARYSSNGPTASFSIMNWWDQGYWITQTAHRVPVSNPTQTGAPEAARFLTATDEAAALEILARNRSKYAVLDFELPFRDGENGSLQGRFQNLVDWAGLPAARYYSLCFSRRNDMEQWQPTWIYREPYYQSMAYRLMVLGGGGIEPANNTWVVQLRNRTDATGRPFCEIANRWQYGRPDEAKLTAAQRGEGFEAVGLTPWQPAFTVAPVSGLKIAAEFRDPTQQPNETPMIRVFEVAGSRLLIPPSTP